MLKLFDEHRSDALDQRIAILEQRLSKAEAQISVLRERSPSARLKPLLEANSPTLH